MRVPGHQQNAPRSTTEPDSVMAPQPWHTWQARSGAEHTISKAHLKVLNVLVCEGCSPGTDGRGGRLQCISQAKCVSKYRVSQCDGAAALAQMAEEEEGSAGSVALPRLRTRGLAQGLSHSASSSPRCHSARLATSPRSSAPTLLEHSDLSLTTNSLLEPLLEQRLGRPRRPPMPTLTGLSGMSSISRDADLVFTSLNCQLPPRQIAPANPHWPLRHVPHPVSIASIIDDADLGCNSSSCSRPPSSASQACLSSHLNCIHQQRCRICLHLF